MRSYYIIKGTVRIDRKEFYRAFMLWRITGGRLYGVDSDDKSILMGERDR
jgi:hypothetical protein